MYFFEHHGMEEKEFFKYSSLDNISFPLHFHRAFEIICVEKGKMVITIEDEEYELSENEAVIVFPNQLHKLHTESESTSKVIIFSPELIGHFYTAYKGVVPENNKLYLHTVPHESQVDALYAQKSFLYSICDLLIKHTAFTPVTVSSKRKIIQNMLLFIDENYHKECTLKDVAQAIQYDYAYLSKLFYHYTNLTFTNYVNRYRITQAAYLLESTEDTISEIAMKCGYKTLRTFNRNFKEYKKVSPSFYREKINTH
ncbi:AraC family transcriptional regulator [Alkalibacterium iburiense]|uniref:AraC family transcriptional regulator n=1 Tax=Alkalibacterium iburiense TaxID=290589 RepID=A0ABN0XH08_9LACT